MDSSTLEQPQPPQAQVSFTIQHTNGISRELALSQDALVSEMMAQVIAAAPDPHQQGGSEEDVVGPEAVPPLVREGRFFLFGKELKAGQTLLEAGIRAGSIVVFEGAPTSEEPDKPSPEGPQTVALSSSCQTGVVAFNEAKQDFAVMVSMQAPLLDDVKRVPIDLVLVIDRSGSMRSMMGLV